jgi:hypothetical protein
MADAKHVALEPAKTGAERHVETFEHDLPETRRRRGRRA